MPYMVVENYNGGMDRRRIRVDSAPNTLYNAVNCHINRGGQLESRKNFTAIYDLPDGQTFGLADKAGTLFTFGSDTAVSVPSGITYQQLQHPDGSTGMSAIVDVDVFDGNLYVIAEFTDGSVYHYYNGTRVDFWDDGTVQSGATSISDIASAIASSINSSSNYLASASSNIVTVTANTAGTPFTITTTENSSNGSFTTATTTANVVGVTEVLATGKFTITGGTGGTLAVAVNGVTITSTPVAWNTDTDTTATDVAANITANTSSPDYNATASGSVVTITAVAGSGSTPNGFAIVNTPSTDITTGSIVNMGGGVDAVTAVAQIDTITVGGTWTAGESYIITINGENFGGNTSNYTALTFDTKMYATVGSVLRFCKLNDPSEWDESVAANVGAGFINISNHFSGSDALTALAVYQNNLAIFARRAIQVWSVDADPDNNSKLYTIQSTGTISPHSVKAFGTSDVFYLNDGGVRSLKARDSSNSPTVNDVGRPIDEVIIAKLATMSEDDISKAKAIIDPVDGRYWQALGDTIYVLSFFPASGRGNISGWTIYEPGFDIEDMLVVNDQIYVRSGDTVYQYGGADGTDYGTAGDFTITADFPFFDANKPGDLKYITGVDITGEGSWTGTLKTDPKNELLVDNLGTYDDTTLDRFQNLMPGLSASAFALKFTSQGGSKQILGRVMVYFKEGGAE